MTDREPVPTARIGDVMVAPVRQPSPKNLRLKILSQAACDYANKLLSNPKSGWRLESVAKPGDTQ